MDTITIPRREDLPAVVTLTRDDLYGMLCDARDRADECRSSVERLKDEKNDALAGYHRGMNLGVISMIAHLCVKAALSFDWPVEGLVVHGEQTILARRHPAERELAELKAALVEAAQIMKDEVAKDRSGMDSARARGAEHIAGKLECQAAGEQWAARTLRQVAQRHGFADLNGLEL